MADRFRLVIPDRRGYGNSVGEDPSFSSDAEDIVDLLADGAHLVGFFYGGLGCLLTAARRPELVTSLEPVAFRIARSNPSVAEIVQRLAALRELAPRLTPEEFDARFDAALAGQDEPERIPMLDEQASLVVKAIMRERPPWEAEIPCQQLAASTFPRMTLSGGRSPAFEALCDELHARIGGEHIVRDEYGGHGVQHSAGFNDLLATFIEQA